MFLFILVITNICVLHFSYHSYMFWSLGRRSGTTKLYSEWWRTSFHPCLCKRSSLTTRWPCGKQLTPSSLRSQFVGALSTGVRQCGGKFKTLACRLHIWSGKIMALPYLPPDIIPGLFDHLKKAATTDGLVQLCQYISNTWVGDAALWSPRQWSVFNQVAIFCEKKNFRFKFKNYWDWKYMYIPFISLK